jgi:hypothetical protein
MRRAAAFLSAMLLAQGAHAASENVLAQLTWDRTSLQTDLASIDPVSNALYLNLLSGVQSSRGDEVETRWTPRGRPGRGTVSSTQAWVRRFASRWRTSRLPAAGATAAVGGVTLHERIVLLR